MTKEVTYTCHGTHRITRTQQHPPKGWKLDWQNQPGGIKALVWFCPECQSKHPPPNPLKRS